MTAVGLDSVSTAAAARAGISRLRESDQFLDAHGSPIIESCIPWMYPQDEPAGPEEPEPEDEPEAEFSQAPDDVAATDEAEPGEQDEAVPEGDEELDAYELARQANDVDRVTRAARGCVEGVLAARFDGESGAGRKASLFLGVGQASRPGPRFEGAAHEVANGLLASLRHRAERADLTLIPTGNASVIRGLALAAARVGQDPATACLIGGIDSLLPLETLNWYEAARRLKSGSPGRNHGLSPAEAVGFVVVERLTSARSAGRPILAEVAGVGVAAEPNPFLSDRPSRGEGLTEACRMALAASAVPPGEIGAVLCDLDGEFHRAKEWALAEIRCFGNAVARPLFHPADCFGSIGAASAAVLVGIAAVGLSRGWFTKPVLVFCSDDAGECGALVLAPPRDSRPR